MANDTWTTSFSTSKEEEEQEQVESRVGKGVIYILSFYALKKKKIKSNLE